MQNGAQKCAERLLNLTPRLMQTLRVEMRAGRPPELTVPQFRALVFYENHPCGALSAAAEHLGLGVPSASKVVDALAARGLLLRAPNTHDRRRVDIALTTAGRNVLARSRREASAVFARRLDGLTPLELDVLYAVLGRLREVVGARPPAGPDAPESGE